MPPQPLVTVDRAIETRWPGADAMATELAINLFVLSGRVSAFSDALCAKHGVPSPAAFNVLTILEGAGQALPPSTIARKMIVTRPTMTGIVASLAKRRQVRVLEHPDDGRMALVALTARGRGIVLRMRPELHAAEKRWMSCLSRREQRLLRGLVAKLQANAPTLA
jgi:DNA-binding MarR family transcriptional regulator